MKHLDSGKHPPTLCTCNASPTAKITSALFLLFVQYAAPSGTFDERTFDAVKAAEETPTTFNWPKLGWIFIFQYPVVEILCVAVQEATEATGHYCLNSLSPQFAHIWIEVVESVSIGACVYCILAFRNRMKRLMKVRRGLSKLACFKIIVFIRFMQQWIFSLLLEYHVIKTSAAYSYNDILYGIPATATCAEMVLFSLGFWYAFSSTEYSSKAKPREQALPVWKAALHALNPWDIIAGMARIFPLCGEVRRTGDWQAYRLATRDKGISGAVRKGIRKYKNRKGQGQGRYQELDEGAESLTQPAEMHYIPSESRESYQDPGYFPMSGGISGSDMYQVPAGSPPGEVESHLMGEINAGGRPRSSSQSYLMAESVPSARPRASSQSSLMVESQHEPRRPREPSVGHLYDERNGRSRSPSSRRFVDAPTEGREIV